MNPQRQRQVIVDGFDTLVLRCDLDTSELVRAIQETTLYLFDTLMALTGIDGSAPGDASASAGSPPSAGSPRLVSVATGADTHSVHADRLADVVAFRCNPDPSCGQDGAA